MTNLEKTVLVYRGTRDGFTHQAMYEKCDSKSNLVSIIKNNLDYVFGVYTSVVWNKNDEWTLDPKSFLLSVRRNGITKNDKCLIQDDNMAFYGDPNGNNNSIFCYGDIIICNESDKEYGSNITLGQSFQLPDVISDGSAYAKELFLVGSNNGEWLTTEIEVYQIN